MSRFDYEQSKEIAKLDPGFTALIMAAYRKADTTNAVILRRGFPEITEEIEARYNARGGLLPGEKAVIAEPEGKHEYVSMSEAARMIGTSRWLIRKRVNDGQLPAVRVGNGQAIRVKVADVEALLRPIGQEAKS